MVDLIGRRVAAIATLANAAAIATKAATTTIPVRRAGDAFDPQPTSAARTFAAQIVSKIDFPGGVFVCG